MSGERSRGQSMVEFALLLPVLLLLVMGVFAFSLVFNAQLTVTHAAATGARAGSVVNYGEYNMGGHENQAIYDAIVESMSWLGMDRVQSITIYQPAEDGTISSRKDMLNPLNGALISGNFTNNLRMTDTGLGVEIVYHEPVWLPFVNTITGDHIEVRVRESRRIE